MIDALYIATTGMYSGQAQIDNLSNNLANINTAAYKRSTVTFEDLMYVTPNEAIAEFDLNDQISMAGVGARVSSIVKNFDQGDLRATQNDLDVAIQGPGFIEVELENRMLGYTRSGSLRISDDGYLETSNGHTLSGYIQIPPDAEQLNIDENGVVSVLIPGDEESYEVGRIQIANFYNVQGLEASGGNIFLETDKSGVPFYSDENNEYGKVLQGYQESSNVDLVQELVDLMVAQRSYQVNSQVVQAADEIMRINNSLRR